MEDLNLKISTEFSRTPGPRYRKEGRWSGQEFLETLLRERFRLAKENDVRLLIDLDGTAGYATSFLEGSFGELAREVGVSPVLDHLRFKSDEEPYLVDEILNYIREARTGQPEWSASGG